MLTTKRLLAAAAWTGLMPTPESLTSKGLPSSHTQLCTVVRSDLGHVQFKDKITLADPRKSGSVSVLNHIILESLGWEKGSELLARMAGNARQFAQTSSDPIKAITVSFC